MTQNELDALDGVTFSKLDCQTIVNEFDYHRVPDTFGFVLNWNELNKW